MSQELDSGLLDLAKEKGCYPSEYMSVFEKFKEELPTKEKFFVRVWDRSEMKKMKYYPDLYLKCDVLLLADVFQTFTNDTIEKYGLCQSHYLSAPALF